jgi:DNA-binding NarL/FixJ family response regulator
MSDSIRLLLADDHPFYREGVKSMIGATAATITVVGEAGDGAEAVRLAIELAPDVVLMDLAMPVLGGVEATRRLAAARPEIAVLVLTMADDDSVFAALRAGARGYLLKDATVEDLVRAVTAVHHGDAIFSPGAADRVLRSVAHGRAAYDRDVLPELTDRERDVLALLAAGRDNAAIARELFLTPKTVRNYVATILAKLHVQDRASAAEKGRAAGLGPD